MLNLLLFRAVADYSLAPDIAPSAPISGRAAYEIYIAHTLPILSAAGGEVIFSGSDEHFVIGPPHETWNMVLLAQHASLDVLMAMASHPAYLAGAGHSTPALLDSRLLAIESR